MGVTQIQGVPFIKEYCPPDIEEYFHCIEAGIRTLYSSMLAISKLRIETDKDHKSQRVFDYVASLNNASFRSHLMELLGYCGIELNKSATCEQERILLCMPGEKKKQFFIGDFETDQNYLLDVQEKRAKRKVLSFATREAISSEPCVEERLYFENTGEEIPSDLYFDYELLQHKGIYLTLMNMTREFSNDELAILLLNFFRAETDARKQHTPKPLKQIVYETLYDIYSRNHSEEILKGFNIEFVSVPSASEFK